MIEADRIGVLPEPAARRHAQTMPIQIILLRDEWAVGELKICVRSLHRSRLARDLIDELLPERSEAQLRGL
jgi:hypothetical protein